MRVRKIEYKPQTDKKKWFLAIYMTLLLIAMLWFVKIAELLFEIPLTNYGIRPREISGLIGILTTGFLHANFVHLISNSIALLVVMPLLYYFYRPVALKIMLSGYIMTGIFTWIIAAGGNHIGASGLVYMIFGFLVLSGFIRRHYRLMAVGFLMLIVHSTFSGSLLMKFIPEMNKPNISWEGHLSGFVSGLILAVVYRKEGPQRPEYTWDDEEDDEEDAEEQEVQHEQGHNPPYPVHGYHHGHGHRHGQVSIEYEYKESDKKPDS